MANEENLKRPTAKEAREKGRKGGIASGKARREKKALREIVENALATLVKAKQDGKDVQIPAKEAMVLKQVQKALKGDNKSLELLLKLSGEMPSEKIALEGELHNTLEVKITGGKGEETPTADDEI